MSWARNVQSRIQQQQQFQSFKPQPLQPGQPQPDAPPSPKLSPSLSATVNVSVPAVPPASLSKSPSMSSAAAVVSNASVSISSPNTSPPSTPASVIKTSGGVVSASVSVPVVSVSVPSPTPSPTPSPSVPRSSTASSSTLMPNQSPVTPVRSTPTTTPVHSRQSSSTGPYIFPQKIQQKVLTTDMFKGEDFSPVNFVEDLTRKIVNDQMGSDGLHFDPNPFNSLFLNTQLQLSQLEANIDRKLDDLADECNDFNVDYKSKLQDLLGSYQECFQQFKKLEKGVSTIGTKAVHFGDELDSVHQQKNKAQSALSLINYLLELNNPTTQQRSDIFTNSDRIHELAQLVKKLSSVSEDIKEISGFGQGKLETENISNTLENDLLNQFEKAAERNDFEKMKQCATTLYNFNGGERCRGRYVQKVRMFFDVDSIRKDESLALNTSKRIIRGNNIIDTRFEIFYTEILKDIAREQNVIQNVFINQTSAMAMLIVRVFEQRVRMFVENVLGLERNNNLMYLQTVHYSFTNTKKLLVDPLSSYGIVGVDLNQLLNSIFCTYQEGYITKEMHSLSDIYVQSLNEEIDRLQNLDKVMEYEEDGLNHEITQTFIQQTENALTRSYTLSPDGMVADNIKTIFFSLLRSLFVDYIEFVLDKYMRLLPANDARCLASISQFFRVVLGINQIVGQIQTMFQLFVLPPITTNMNIQSQCSDQLYFHISTLETKICIGLESALSTMVALIEKTLLDQKRTDYQVEEYDNSVTPTCSASIKLIHSLYDTIKNCLQGKNFSILVEELGLKAQSVFLNHFKKFKVGQGVGTLKLVRDLTEYRNFFKMFKSHKVDDAFELLFEISKLHLVNPDNFKAVIEGGALSRMPKPDLFTFIKQRSDFKSPWLDTLLV